MEFLPPNFMIFSLVRYSIDDYEKTSVFNMLNHLLANLIYTVIRTYKPTGQSNLTSSAGGARAFPTVLKVNPRNSWSGGQLTIPI